MPNSAYSSRISGVSPESSASLKTMTVSRRRASKPASFESLVAARTRSLDLLRELAARDELERMLLARAATATGRRDPRGRAASSCRGPPRRRAGGCPRRTARRRGGGGRRCRADDPQLRAAGGPLRLRSALDQDAFEVATAEAHLMACGRAGATADRRARTRTGPWRDARRPAGQPLTARSARRPVRAAQRGPSGLAHSCGTGTCLRWCGHAPACMHRTWPLVPER